MFDIKIYNFKVFFFRLSLFSPFFLHLRSFSSIIPEEICKTPLFEEHDEWEPDNTSPIGSYSSGGSGGRHSGTGRRNNNSDRGGGGGGGRGGGGDNGSVRSRGDQPLLSRVTPKSEKKSRQSPGPDASLLSNTSNDNSSEDDEDYDEGKIS